MHESDAHELEYVANMWYLIIHYGNRVRYGIGWCVVKKEEEMDFMLPPA